ncbi:MAG: helix-turn-helix domain-containing protein [Sphingobacteriales bacterium]|nr:helix-turn-helix domain-containing protein [Sphingobacteriales bacterium]
MAEVILTNIPLDQLAAKIAEIISSRSSSAEPVRAESNVKYLSRAEAAGQLHVTLATLAAWTKSGKLKAHRIGRRVLYKANELERALLPIRVK